MTRRRFNTDRLKLELKRARRPFMQYLFLVGVAAFCLVIVLKNQFYDRPWESKYEFKAAFEDVKGVTPGVQKVKIAGVEAGVVSAAKVRDKQAILTIRIKKKYGPVYKDAQLRLRPLTPLQDMYVSIDRRGSRQAGALRDGDVLAAQRTISPVDISRVLNNFPTATRRRLQILLDQFGRGMEDNGAELRAAFAQAAPFLDAARRTAGVIASRRRNMARVVHNLGALTDALAERDKQLTSLVDAGNATLASLSGADDELGATLQEIPPTLDVLRTAFTRLRSAEDQLDPALSDLQPVADQLERGLNGLQRFSRDADPALAALRPAFRELAPFARDLRPTTDQLADAFTRLRPQAPKYERIVKQIKPCEDVIMNFFNDTLSVLKFQDAYGAFPRGDDGEDTDTVGGLVQNPIFKKSPTCTGGYRK